MYKTVDYHNLDRGIRIIRYINSKIYPDLRSLAQHYYAFSQTCPSHMRKPRSYVTRLLNCQLWILVISDTRIL